MTQDRPLLGITLMLGFSMVAPLGDAVTKLLGDLMPVVFFVFIRFTLQALYLTPLVLLNRRALHVTPRQAGLIFLRTLFHMIGIGAMFTAFRYLPLADAVAIAFVMPFISLLIGKLFLGEDVGLRRILACCVGFSGALLVIQPSFVVVGTAALWPLVVAVAFAFFMLVGRKVATEMDPLVIQTISGYMAAVFILPVLLVGDALALQGFEIFWPEGRTLALLLLIGFLGTVAHLLMTWSLRYAPSTTLAPLSYVEIPATTLVGFLVFGDFPNGLAALGIVITMAAGLYIIFRARAMSQPSSEAPQP